MRNIIKGSMHVSGEIQMHDQDSFYKAFEKDLLASRSNVIIESPFITTKRISVLMPALTRLVDRGVRITINTRNPIEHDAEYQVQAIESIEALQSIGVLVLYTVKLHRKVAVIDDTVIWNGSLNILSQNDSCELMWRVASMDVAARLLGFIDIKAYTRR